MKETLKRLIITTILIVGGWLCLYTTLFVFGLLNVSFNTVPMLIILPIIFWIFLAAIAGSASLKLGRLRFVAVLVIAVLCFYTLGFGIIDAWFKGFRVYVEKRVSIKDLQEWAIITIARDQADQLDIVDSKWNGPIDRTLSTSELPSFLNGIRATKPKIGLVDVSLTGDTCIAFHWEYLQGLLIAGPEFENQWRSNYILFYELAPGVYVYAGTRP